MPFYRPNTPRAALNLLFTNKAESTSVPQTSLAAANTAAVRQFRQPKYAVNLALRTSGARDVVAAALQVGASGLGVGRFFQPAYRRLPLFGANADVSSAIAVSETNPHFTGRFSQQKFRAPALNAQAADIGDAFQVETNPHFAGKFSQAKYRTIVFGQAVDDAQGVVDAPTNFLARFAPAKYRIYAFNAQAADVEQPQEIGQSFIGRSIQASYRTSTGLRFAQATDVDVPIVQTDENNPHFIGRFVQGAYRQLVFNGQNGDLLSVAAPPDQIPDTHDGDAGGQRLRRERGRAKELPAYPGQFDEKKRTKPNAALAVRVALETRPVSETASPVLVARHAIISAHWPAVQIDRAAIRTAVDDLINRASKGKITARAPAVEIEPENEISAAVKPRHTGKYELELLGFLDEIDAPSIASIPGFEAMALLWLVDCCESVT